MKKILSILVILCLAAGMAGCACAESPQGQAMPDFSVELTDGTTVTLSELLRTKEVVVLNIFTTWCGPCQGEFPEMEAVYQQYKDRMEIVAVSPDSGDDMETLRLFKEEMGVTFPMGQAGADIVGSFEIPGYPTTFIFDRNGRIAHYEVGAFVNDKAFEKVVTPLMGDDYTGKQLWLYTIYVADQWMDLVQDVDIQVCTDTMCTVVNTGEDGFAFIVTEEPAEYHIKILTVPDGYTVYKDDTEAVTGGESARFQLNVYRQGR